MKIIKERKLVGSHVSILELNCKTFCKVQISYDASTENYEYPRLLRNKQL